MITIITISNLPSNQQDKEKPCHTPMGTLADNLGHTITLMEFVA
jgi:hypothetical protein